MRVRVGGLIAARPQRVMRLERGVAALAQEVPQLRAGVAIEPDRLAVIGAGRYGERTPETGDAFAPSLDAAEALNRARVYAVKRERAPRQATAPACPSGVVGQGATVPARR